MSKWENDKAAKYWLEAITSAGTKRNYRREFPIFLEHVNKTPSEIIEERRQDLNSADPQQRRRYEHLVIAFQNRLIEEKQKQGVSLFTIRGYLRTVQSFFSINGYPLKFRRSELKAPKPNKAQKRIVANEEIRALYSFANPTERAITLTLYHTGMSSTDACSLNIEDYDFYNAKAPLYFEKYREKSDMLTGTCFSEDALYDIRLMLQERGNPQKGALFTTRQGSRFNERTVRMALQNLAKKALIQNFTPKDLRDAYHDALQRANINGQVIDRMMGHSLGGARDSYKISPYTVMEAYQQAFPYLTINHARRERESEAALKARVASLEKFIKENISASQEQMKIEIDAVKNELTQEKEFRKELLTTIAKALGEKGIDLKKLLSEQSA